MKNEKEKDKKDKTVQLPEVQLGSLLEDNPTRKNHGRPLPPVATRFKKGMSGNPKGRPRNRETISKLMREKFEQTSESDAQDRTFAQLFVQALLHKALQGDVKACKLIWERHDGKIPPPDPKEGKITWESMTSQERRNWSTRMGKMIDAIYGLDRSGAETAPQDIQQPPIDDEENV